MGEFNPEGRANEVREELNQMQILQDLREEDVGYQEVFVKSFTEAVDDIEKDSICKDDEFNITLLDIDGVLFKDNIVKLPVASHFVTPRIKERPKNAYNRLVKLTNGNLIISTNRSESERLLFNSQKVLNQVKELVNSNGLKIPIFTNLFKQKPGVTKENLSDTQPLKLPEYKVIKPRVDTLVHYIGKLATEKDFKKFSITSIEDWSIISLNRKDFLMYVANQLKNEYGIEVESIRNYVIKR